MSSKKPQSLTKDATDKKQRAASKSPSKKKGKDGSLPTSKIAEVSVNGSPSNTGTTTTNVFAASSRSPSSEKTMLDGVTEVVAPKADPVLKCDPLSCVPSRETWSTMRRNPISCMPNGCIQPEQYYACDREVAKSLAQYLSPDERKKVQAWLVTLEQMTLDDDELSERFMYMTCLMMLLKVGQLVPPFTRFPPARPLRSLREHIDKHLFKKVQIECRRRRMDELDQYEQPDRTVEQKPTQFLYQMPMPNNGILCYGAAFSTM